MFIPDLCDDKDEEDELYGDVDENEEKMDVEDEIPTESTETEGGFMTECERWCQTLKDYFTGPLIEVRLNITSRQLA